MTKYFKMNAEGESDNSKFYDMNARDAKSEVGQKFKMAADDGEESGRVKHSQKKDDTVGRI
jgi:hypothetical protein